MGIFWACFILLFALMGVVGTLVGWWTRMLLGKCKEFSVEDLVKDESVSFPVHVKMNGKVGAYDPVTSPIANHPNCFRCSSTITYHYDTMTEVITPNGSLRNIDYHSIVIWQDSRLVKDFALIGSNGELVSVDVAQAKSVGIETTERFHHKEKRHRCDSSYYTLRNPSNDKFEFPVNRTLPIPYKKAWFEMEEEWTDLTSSGDGRLTVIGVATKDNGVISIGAIKTFLGDRMTITDMSIKRIDQFMVGFHIVCFLLALITLPLGLVFLFKSLEDESVEIL